MNTTTAANQTTAGQTFGARTVSIVRNSKGQRAAKITTTFNTRFVPVELLGLATGRDAWMRDIMVRCSCGAVSKAGEMEGEYCAACYDKAGEENAAADGN